MDDNTITIIGVVVSLVISLIIGVITTIYFLYTKACEIYVKTDKGKYTNFRLESGGNYNYHYLANVLKIKKILKVYGKNCVVTIENKDNSLIQYDESTCKTPLEKNFTINKNNNMIFPCDGIELNKNPDIIIKVRT